MNVVIFRSILLFSMIFSWSMIGEAASVKSVNKKKKLVIIELEDGEVAPKGTKICFHNDSDKRIACAKVIRSKDDRATAKIKNKKQLAKIKTGMAAKIETTEDLTAEGSENHYSGTKSPLRIWLLYNPAIIAPFTYNKLAYEAPKDANPTTLWQANGKLGIALFGFAAQAAIPLGPFAIIPGIRYRLLQPGETASDYQLSSNNPYVSAEQSASSLGFWTDFQYFRLTFSPALAMHLTGGFDMDMSTVTLKATKKDDTGAISEATITDTTSSLTVASIRVGAGFDFLFAKPFGAHLGTTFLLPLAEFGKNLEGEIDDTETRGLGDANEDLNAQLGHKKNTFGLELSLGVVLEF